MATYDFDRIYAVKKRAEGRLLAIPGVHGVGLGAKFVAGGRTREPAIMVFVTGKKPVGELPPHEIIPTEIDGVKTDVIESAPPRLHFDDKTYRPIDGGVQIELGGSVGGGGTLGCIGRTNGPVPMIVGITNQHVVAQAPRAATTGLAITIPANPHVNMIAFRRTGLGVTPRGTLVVSELKRGQRDGDRAFYATRGQDEAPEDIALGVAKAITAIGAGYSASAVGAQVTIAEAAGTPFAHGARVFGPQVPRGPADLHATIDGNEITLSGRASERYGIYTNWNVGGEMIPSRGVFTRVGKGSDLLTIAASVASAINADGASGITATAAGSKVLVTGPQALECNVSSDVRVGQPGACFCSACCACCGNLVGVVHDARLELDAALIELAAGLQYRAEVEQIGFIHGTRTYTLIDVIAAKPIAVRKRGMATGRTEGEIVDIDHVGEIVEVREPNTLDEWSLLHRFYGSALVVKGTTPFSDHGDSGSAVLNEDHEVVGILFGGGDNFSYVTPIAAIEDAFDLSVVTATAPGQVNTVPATQVHAFAAVNDEPIFVERLRDIERELTATPEGRTIAEAGRRHADEVVRLVNHNRRVGTVWRRNGGPELVQIALALAQAGDRHVPRQINDRPLAECLRPMQAILTRYGSAPLAADLRRYGPRILELTALDYPQILAALAAVS